LLTLLLLQVPVALHTFIKRFDIKLVVQLVGVDPMQQRLDGGRLEVVNFQLLPHTFLHSGREEHSEVLAFAQQPAQLSARRD